MANPLDIEPAPSLARDASGFGSAIDIGVLRTGAELELLVSVTPVGADALLTVTLETSEQSGAGFRVVGSFPPVTSTGQLKVQKHFGDLDRYVRVSWTIEGSGSPSFTFQVVGTAHVLYAEPRHVRGLGIQAGALDDLDDNALAEFCIVASTEMDGYLGGGFTLPLAKWGPDVRLHGARLAVYHLLSARGRQPLGPDDIIDAGHKNALKWLIGVSKGTIVPPGIVDATPEVEERAFAVASDPPIEW